MTNIWKIGTTGLTDDHKKYLGIILNKGFVAIGHYGRNTSVWERFEAIKEGDVILIYKGGSEGKFTIFRVATVKSHIKDSYDKWSNGVAYTIIKDSPKELNFFDNDAINRVDVSFWKGKEYEDVKLKEDRFISRAMMPTLCPVKEKHIQYIIDKTVRDKLMSIKNSEKGATLQNSRVLKDELIRDDDLSSLLTEKKQVILYGPPGTGKTYRARQYTLGKNSDFIVFHQSYAYEEFIEGIFPQITAEPTGKFEPKEDGKTQIEGIPSNNVSENNEIRYICKPGKFKTICLKAINEILKSSEVDKAKQALQSGKFDETNPLAGFSDEDLQVIFRDVESKASEYYLVVDEINRGNISKIFGELIALLEKDKRLGSQNQLVVTLPYSNHKFAVPPNVYLIGTMNTADRSIALLDVALRRRFGFIEIIPSYSLLVNRIINGTTLTETGAVDEIKRWIANNETDEQKLAIAALYTINQKIKVLKDCDHQIGHSYLLTTKNEGGLSKQVIKSGAGLKAAWKYEIVPLLREYFYTDWRRLYELLGDEFIEVKKISAQGISWRSKDDLGIDDGEDAYSLQDEINSEFADVLKSIIGSPAKSEGQESVEE